MLSRPRSSTPTMHDQITRDRHRLKSADEAGRHGGNLAATSGRGSPYHQPAVKRQQEGRIHDGRMHDGRLHEGRCQRSQSSDHHRPISKAVLYFVAIAVYLLLSH